MSMQDDREKRWFAYYLGEANPEERAQIEAELRASPDQAAEVQRLIEGVSRWAGEPVPHTPFSPDALGPAPAEARPRGGPLRRSVRTLGRWSWGLAAAALLLFALSRVEFTVSSGDATFSWGPHASGGQAERLDGKIMRLAEQLERIEQAAMQNSDHILALALRDTVLTDEWRSAAAQLAQNQQIEAATRYRDIQNLVQMAGYGDLGTREVLAFDLLPMPSTATQRNGKP